MSNTRSFSTTAPIESLTLKPGVILIGRADRNDLRIQDAQVSAYHAKIVTFFKASYIEDLGSVHGTFVNGNRVEKHTIHPGDLLIVGEHQFRVEADSTDS